MRRTLMAVMAGAGLILGSSSGVGAQPCGGDPNTQPVRDLVHEADEAAGGVPIVGPTVSDLMHGAECSIP